MEGRDGVRAVRYERRGNEGPSVCNRYIDRSKCVTRSDPDIRRRANERAADTVGAYLKRPSSRGHGSDNVNGRPLSLGVHGYGVVCDIGSRGDEGRHE